MKTVGIEGLKLAIEGNLLRIARIPEECEDYVDVDDPEKVVCGLRKVRPRPDLFNFWQRLPETQPKFPYYMEWDNVAAVPVKSFDEWLKQAVHSSVRTKLRRAKKAGVVVERADFSEKLIKGIEEIFNETPIRQGRPYEHYGKTLVEIRSEWSADLERSAFLGAFFENELIGFVKLTFTERYAELSGTICKLRHRDKSPMNTLIAAAVEFCEAKRLPYLTYGKYTYGKKGEDSLTDFKRYNGFQRVELPRYYVPLTMRGRVGLKLGLHHRLADHLPDAARKLLLKLRTRYYLRNLGRSSEAVTAPERQAQPNNGD